MDDDQLKNGWSMILDPFGDIIAELGKVDNDIAIATLTPEKLNEVVPKAAHIFYIPGRSLAGS